MDNSGQKINGSRYHIKVNKMQISKNRIGNQLLDDVQCFNDSPKVIEHRNKFMYSEMKNNDNNGNYYRNGLDNNFYTEGNYPSSASKEFKYHKININQKYNINKNKQSFTSLNNQKYQKKFVNNENGKKYIFKSESHYPLNKNRVLMIENDNNIDNISMRNNSPFMKNLFSKNINSYKKDNNENNIIYEKTEIGSKNYYLYDNEQNTNKKEAKIIGKYSNVKVNKLGHYFYKPVRKKSIINNYNNNNIIYTEYPKNNERNNINFPNYSYTNINNYNDNNSPIKNNNNFNNNKINKTSESNDRKMIFILKKKIIIIFMRFMNDIYDNYTKKFFNELMCKLRQNLYSSTFNKKYRTKRLMNINDNNKYNLDNNNSNYFYIKKNYKINITDNNNNNNNDNLVVNSLSVNKNYSSMEMYKNAIRNNKFHNNQKYYDHQIYMNNTNSTNIDNLESEEFKKRSYNNLYIPVKNRNNNYYHFPRQKDSIFNELKINKSIKLFDNSNIIQNQNINTQINNFYNTNNSNFYINKINSFSSVMTIDKQKSKIFISKNHRNNSESPNNSSSKEKVKGEIYKNKKKLQNMVYKKIISNEKADENINLKKDKSNVFMKKMERIYSKNNKINKNNINDINLTYSMKILNNFNNNNSNSNKNQFATIGNYTNDNNENNYYNVSPDISNDANNYNLEDIDKPINMFHMKNNMDIDNDQDNENNENVENDNKNEEECCNNINKEDIDIKNLIQIITNDRRLFINFNYVKINKYKTRNNIRKNNLYMFKVNNLFILGKGNNNDNENNFNEAPEKINKNLNKYIRKRKIKNCLLKFDNIINNKISEYKSLFFDILKNNIFINIINKIIQNEHLNIIKTFFNLLKSYENKEKNNNTDNKDIILDKNNINCINEDEKSGDINNSQDKEKLKVLIQKINTNFENKRNRNINNMGIEISSLDEEDDNNNNKDRNDNYIPLWKSVQINNIDLNSKKSRNIYSKKKVKLNENSSYRSSDYKNISINNKHQKYQDKIELFRNKLLKYFFIKASNI